MNIDEQLNQKTALDNILTFYETEMIVEHITPIDIKEYGSKKWFSQSNTLQKLNLQAHINALTKGEEFVMESFATFDKINVLIHEMVTSRVWKTYVLPKLMDKLVKGTSMLAYMCLYHECVCCNLLEVFMYHVTAVEQSETFLIDLIEYCYRRLVWLTQKQPLQIYHQFNILKSPQKKIFKIMTAKERMGRTKTEELEDQYLEMEFQIAMMCLSIVRFLTDHSASLPVSALHHMVCQCDMLCVLVPLIEIRPWIREFKGERQQFEKSRWVTIEKSDYSKVVKLEAQVWIAIYNIFMDIECRRKYEFNEFRKGNMLRLKKFMNELLLDQIPLLNEMLRPLEELRLMQCPPTSNMNNFVVEMMPELMDKIKKGRNFTKLAKYQAKKHFGKASKQQISEEMKALSDLYGYNMIDGLIDGFRCAFCQAKDATKRCSRCKSEWYCKRECQVSHWKDHKKFCQTIYEEMIQKKQAGNENLDVTDPKQPQKPKKIFVEELPEQTFQESSKEKVQPKTEENESSKIEEKVIKTSTIEEKVIKPQSKKAQLPLKKKVVQQKVENKESSEEDSLDELD